jgi:hypothetical protein
MSELNDHQPDPNRGTYRPGDPVPPDSVIGNSALWQHQAPKPPKKHTVRNAILIGIGSLVAVVSLAAVLSPGTSDAPASVTTKAGAPVDNGPTPIVTPTSKPSAAKPSTQPSPKVTHKPAPTTTKPVEPAMTASQEQAVGKAEDYLNGQSFSRKGLIEQLVFEGFSAKDAKFGVDHVEVNWNSQAVGKAKEYLNGQHFSRSGLIEQLEYEGFTHKQAVYGVTKAGL